MMTTAITFGHITSTFERVSCTKVWKILSTKSKFIEKSKKYIFSVYLNFLEIAKNKFDSLALYSYTPHAHYSTCEGNIKEWVY